MFHSRSLLYDTNNSIERHKNDTCTCIHSMPWWDIDCFFFWVIPLNLVIIIEIHSWLFFFVVVVTVLCDLLGLFNLISFDSLSLLSTCCPKKKNRLEKNSTRHNAKEMDEKKLFTFFLKAMKFLLETND